MPKSKQTCYLGYRVGPRWGGACRPSMSLGNCYNKKDDIMTLRKYDNEQHPGFGIALTRKQAWGWNSYSGDGRGKIIMVGCRSESKDFDEREVKGTRSSCLGLRLMLALNQRRKGVRGREHLPLLTPDCSPVSNCSVWGQSEEVCPIQPAIYPGPVCAWALCTGFRFVCVFLPSWCVCAGLTATAVRGKAWSRGSH